MKKFIKVLLAICISLTCALTFVACGGGGDDDGEQGGGSEYFVYTEVDGGYAIGGMHSDSVPESEQKTLRIPETYNGEPVVAIADEGFMGWYKMEQVIFTKNIKTIGESAFYNCGNLTNIWFPANSPIETIGYRAFAKCSKLETIDLMLTDLNYIGERAFEDCTLLKNIQLRWNMTKIEAATFRRCSSLKWVAVYAPIEEIGESAFSGCTSLEWIELPKTVETIKTDAFNTCSSLQSIFVSGLRAEYRASVYTNGNNKYFDAKTYFYLDPVNDSWDYDDDGLTPKPIVK